MPGLVTYLLREMEHGGQRWFRGQGCHLRKLRPSLARQVQPFDPAAMLKQEERLITRFRQRSLPYWPEGYPQDDWEQLFSMQHYGVPTRLLDWSENALMAAFFAADHDPTRCECGDGSCLPTIWALDPVLLNRNNPRLDGYGEAMGVLATTDEALDPWAPRTEGVRFGPEPVALYGTHNSARIVAQQGTFTVSGKYDVPLEEGKAATSHDGVLEKITILGERDQIMIDLKMLGITRGVVYPGLGGVAHDITAGELG